MTVRIPPCSVRPHVQRVPDYQANFDMLPVFLISAACLLIFASTMQFAATGLMSVNTACGMYRRRQMDVQALRQKTQMARLRSQLSAQSNTTTSLEWRVMEVAEVVQESEDCKSFYFTDPYKQTLPDFRPGQYLMVRPAIAGAYQTTRCYSLSSAPDPRFWRITVKRQDEGPASGFRKNGGLSRWLHREISAGDCLLVGGPSGNFYLPEASTCPIVLLAAGVGITPMVSMLRWSLEHMPERRVTLLYQVKDVEHWPLGETLLAWQRTNPNCQVVTFLSRTGSDEIDELNAGVAVDGLPTVFEAGKFDDSHVIAAMPAENTEFYMCGPDGWMQSIREGLMIQGVPTERIHWESFGGGQPSPIAVADSASSAEAFEVRFEHSNRSAMWADPEQSLWELARENDVEIPSGCLSGACGSCRVKLLKGSVKYDRHVSVDLESDECLACVAKPVSSVVVDA